MQLFVCASARSEALLSNWAPSSVGDGAECVRGKKLSGPTSQPAKYRTYCNQRCKRLNYVIFQIFHLDY